VYNSVLQHRGSACTAAQGPDRVALILSFASPPDDSNDNHNVNSSKRNDNSHTSRLRLPPLDTVYGIRSDHLGCTLNDFKDPVKNMQFWKLRWTGFFETTQQGWNSFRLDTFRTDNIWTISLSQGGFAKSSGGWNRCQGFLSVLLGVKVQDAPPEYQPVEYHAMRLLWRIRAYTAVAAIMVAGVYAWAVIYFVKVQPQSRTVRMATWLRRIMYVAVAVASGQWYIWQVEQTDWARGITVNRNIGGVLPTKGHVGLQVHKTQSYLESVATPVA
jgi:hypothetical protein